MLCGTRRNFEPNGSNRNGYSVLADPREVIASLISIKPIDGLDGERWYPVIEAARNDTRAKIYECLSVITGLVVYPKGR